MEMFDEEPPGFFFNIRIDIEHPVLNQYRDPVQYAETRSFQIQFFESLGIEMIDVREAIAVIGGTCPLHREFYVFRAIESLTIVVVQFSLSEFGFFHDVLRTVIKGYYFT